MEMYFLKSAACLAILMLFYKLLLEKENMHVFKRFYLLAAVLVSFAIPWITFTSYVEIPAVPYTNLFEVEEGAGAEGTSVFASLWAVLLWMLYGLGVLFFGFKFYRNLQEILQKIRRNPQVKAGNTTNVLLQEEVAPHTFWNYIFLNRAKYQQRQIPEEVFEHEQAHARQRHSLDILLMELLQVILWFHPLLYLVKRAIKLNHEFLADRAVIKKGIKTSTYQEMLLAFSSSAANSSFVNSINYSSIKKRFTVMRTHTSRRRIWLRSLLLLPLLAGLLYSFSTRKTEFTDPASASSEHFSSEILEISVDEKGIIRVRGKQMSLSEIRENLKPEKYTNYAVNTSPNAPKEVMEELMQVVLSLRVEGTVTVCSSGEESAGRMNVLKELFKNEEEQEKATPKMIAEYNKLARHYREQQITEETVQEENFKRMMYIFGIMTEEQRADAEKLPPPPPPARVTKDLPAPPPPPVKEVEVIGHPAPTGTAEAPSPSSAPVKEVVVMGYPTPRSPEQAIKNWQTEGAEFYFNGKKITAQDALELIGSETKHKVEVDDSGPVKKIKLSEKKN